MTDSTKPSERQETICRAIIYFDDKWPEQLDSGIMFFAGLRITKDEFDGVRANQGKSNG